jgi:acyl-CoA synthetase (AMP-forming)/AMP-acid ligase II
LTTGDFGRIDENGRLHLAGRANELYIRGGYNVYPAEVEAVLGTHDRVEQAAVVGAPDPVLGEIGVAFVVLTGGAPLDTDELLAELRELCRRSLADYKAPDRVVVAPELPLTPMMKVDKAALAERVGQTTNGVRAS